MKKLIYILVVLMALPICLANNALFADYYTCDSSITSCPYSGNYLLMHHSLTYLENEGWRDGFWKNRFSWPEQIYNYQYEIGSISQWNLVNTGSRIKYIEILQGDLRWPDGVRNETRNILVGNYTEENTPTNYPLIEFVTLNRVSSDKHDATFIHIRIVFEDGDTAYYLAKNLISFTAYMPSSKYGFVCKQQQVIQEDIKRSKLGRMDEIRSEVWDYTKNIISFNLEIFGYILLILKILIVLLAIGILLYFIFYLVNLIRGEGREEI